MNIVILSSFHTYPTSPLKFWCYKESLSRRQPHTQHTHVYPAVQAQQQLWTWLLWIQQLYLGGTKQPHQQGASKYITHTGPWEGAIPPKQESSLE